MWEFRRPEAYGETLHTSNKLGDSVTHTTDEAPEDAMSDKGRGAGMLTPTKSAAPEAVALEVELDESMCVAAVANSANPAPGKSARPPT